VMIGMVKRDGEVNRSLPQCPLRPSIEHFVAVRRLQLREELDRSSCGNVLFNGYLPPPGGHSMKRSGQTKDYVSHNAVALACQDYEH
jgi:hypothetical protein